MRRLLGQFLLIDLKPRKSDMQLQLTGKIIMGQLDLDSVIPSRQINLS